MLMTFSVIGFWGCVQNEYYEPNYLSREEAYKVTYPYLSYSEGKFTLLLSESEANRLRVSPQDYSEMIAYIGEANAIYKQMSINRPAVKFYNPIINFVAPRTKTGNEIQDPTPTSWDYQQEHIGSMTGQEYAYENIWIPEGYTDLRVVVYSNSTIGFGSVTMNSGYGSETLGTYNILFWNGAAEFRLPVSSGMDITLQIGVASSCGGTYSVYFGK